MGAVSNSIRGLYLCGAGTHPAAALPGSRARMQREKSFKIFASEKLNVSSISSSLKSQSQVSGLRFEVTLLDLLRLQAKTVASRDLRPETENWDSLRLET